MVMIPQKSLQWLIEQPEADLNLRAVQGEKFAIPYLAPTFDFNHDMYMVEVVRKDLTRNLGRIQPKIFEEIRTGVESVFGNDTKEWKEVTLLDCMQKILYRSTTRALVGEPLCDNQAFLRTCASWSKFLGIGAVVVGQILPSGLKPIVGYLLAVPIYICQKIAFRQMIPQIEARTHNLRLKNRDPTFKWEESKDVLTWMAMAALQVSTAELIIVQSSCHLRRPRLSECSRCWKYCDSCTDDDFGLTETRSKA